MDHIEAKVMKLGLIVTNIIIIVISHCHNVSWYL